MSATGRGVIRGGWQLWLGALIALTSVLLGLGIGSASAPQASTAAGFATSWSNSEVAVTTYDGPPRLSHQHTATRAGISTEGVPLASSTRQSAPPGHSHLVSGFVVAAKSGDDLVNLANKSRTAHILQGEVRRNGSFGGGHRPGTGFPNKSEFPAGWSDGKIMHSISDIATDPSLIWRSGNKPGDFFVNGTRSGIDIEVLLRNNQIWTGYPTNVIRNAP